MKKEEHAQLLDSLKNAQSDADKMNIIVQLQQDYHTVLSETEKFKQDFENANAEKMKYAELNNKLWLQANANITTLQNKDVEKGGQPLDNEPPTKRNFEDLNFD